MPGDTSRFEASADSEYRFTGTFWFAAGPALWSTLPGIEENGARFRAVSGTVFLGGLVWLWGARYLQEDTRLAPTRLPPG